MNEYEQLFNEYMSLKFNIQSLAAIVQNPNLEISDEELEEHHKLTMDTCNKLTDLKRDVYNLYRKDLK